MSVLHSMYLIIKLSIQDIIEMQQEKKGFPFYFKGNKNIISQLTFRFDTAIITGKPYPVSVELAPQLNEKLQILEPIIYIQTIDDNTRQLIMKNKYTLKPEFFYVYYPSQIRVDQKIYKIYSRHFENLVDEVPRNYKGSFGKYVIWEEGRGQFSIEYQKQRINEQISLLGKQLIQKKIEAIVSQIRNYQAQPLNSKSMLHIFLLKNKLAKIYEYLGLPTCSIEYLQDIWNQIMINFRSILKKPTPYKTTIPTKLQFPPQMLIQPPYIIEDVNAILGYFESNECIAYLRIVTYAFRKLFSFYLHQSHRLYDFEAIKTLKTFIDFILGYVLVMIRPKQWSKEEMMKYDVLRNLWVYEVVSKSLEQLQLKKDGQFVRKDTITSKSSATSHITKTIEQYNRIHTSICSSLRNSIQKIGYLLYKLDNFFIFPGGVISELSFVAEKLSISQISDENLHEIKELAPSGLRIFDLLPSKKDDLHPNILKIFESQRTFSEVYVSVLEIMEESLKNSPYKKVAESLKLTIKKAIIAYDVDYRKSLIAQSILRDEAVSGVLEHVWESLSLIHSLYDIAIMLKHIDFDSQHKSQLIERTQKILFKLVLNTQILNNSQAQNNQDSNKIIINFFSKCLEILNSHKEDKIMENNYLQLGCLISLQVQKKHEGEFSHYIEFMISVEEQTRWFGGLRQSQSAQNLVLVLNKLVDLGNGLYLHMISNDDKAYLQIQLANSKVSFFRKQNNCFIFSVCGDLSLQNAHHPLVANLAYISIKLSEEAQLVFPCSQNFKDNPLHFNIPSVTYHCQYSQPSYQNNLLLYSHIWNPVTLKFSQYNSQQFSLKGAQINIPALNMQVSDRILLRNFVKSYEVDGYALIKNEEISSKQQAKYVMDSVEFYVTFFVKADEKLCRGPSLQCYLVFELQYHDKPKDCVKKIDLKINLPNISVLPLLQITEFSLHRHSQYTILSTSLLPLIIEEITNQPSQYSLLPNQQLNLWSPEIQIAWQHCKKLSSIVQLKNPIQSEFSISIKQSECYKVLEPICICSEKVGRVKIQGMQRGQFELVGKVEGVVQYEIGEEQQKIIDLKLIPIKSGNIILPIIWIDDSLGIWQKAYIVDVEH